MSRRSCERYGIPFIADEVQTGWGRTGVADFGFQAYGVEPDVVVFAKGLANGIPIGGLIATDELAASIKSLSLSTFGGNPIATTAALANLNYIATNQLRENALEVGAYLNERLRELQTYAPRHRRRAGDGSDAGRRVRRRPGHEGTGHRTDRAASMTRPSAAGLLVGTAGLHGNVFRISPPLIIIEVRRRRGDQDPRRVTDRRRLISRHNPAQHLNRSLAIAA